MRILLADDHTIVREGIKMLLTEAYPYAEIVDVSDADGLLEKSFSEKWDVIITDISMPPGISGLDALYKIRSVLPKLPVIILSMQAPRQYAVKAMKAGASAYLTKSAATLELVNAVNRVVTGRKYISQEVASILVDMVGKNGNGKSIDQLSDREFAVFNLLSVGKSVSEISKELLLNGSAVNTFQAGIFEKMGFRSNIELIRFAIDHGLV